MSRILNRQRQLAEQGRIRLGYMLESKGGKSYPKASQTFVLTSHSREHIEAAASLWGGEVEQWQPQGNGAEQWRAITAASEIDAILPPGDPLSQAYEMWNRGGCIRRCDGVTEQLSGSPCQCLAQYGDDWHEQPQGKVCDSKSRLKVLLPDMPGLGSWRLETGSYYATDEIAGMVDFIRGAVGDTVMVPVRLRIEPRTRVAKGQTKQFVVPVLDLRGVTAREIVSGSYSSIRQVEGGESQVAAIESGRPDYVALAQRCESLDAIKSVYADAQAAGVAADVLAQIVEIGKPLAQAQAAPSSPSSPVEAEIVTDAPEPDADAIWQQILAEAGRRKIGLEALEQHFVDWSKGVAATDADALLLADYLAEIKAAKAGAR